MAQIYTGDYRTVSTDSLLRLLDELVLHHSFVEGNIPHRVMDNTYTPEGKVFDKLEFLATTTITYKNLIDNYEPTISGVPSGTIIYGKFLDSDITVAEGGLVIGYEQISR